MPRTGLLPLGPSGLAYDREWAVVDHHDRALRLKQVSRSPDQNPLLRKGEQLSATATAASTAAPLLQERHCVAVLL